MIIAFLHRIADSFTKDLPSPHGLFLAERVVLAFGILASTVFGFVSAGDAGALTGLWVAVLVGSGLSMALEGPRGRKEEPPKITPGTVWRVGWIAGKALIAAVPRGRKTWRVVGVLGAVAAAGGGYYGGWEGGWLWSIAGFMGVLAAAGAVNLAVQILDPG